MTEAESLQLAQATIREHYEALVRNGVVRSAKVEFNGWRAQVTLTLNGYLDNIPVTFLVAPKP